MNRRRIRLLICAGILAQTAAFGGCSGTDEATKNAQAEEQAAAEDTDAEEETDEDAEEEEEEQETVGIESYETLQDFLNSDVMENQLADLSAQFEDADVNVSIRGEGSRLIYEFTYEKLAKERIDSEALERAMDEDASVYGEIADTLQSVVADGDLSILVRYLDKDGEEICSREFSPSGEEETGASS